MTSAATVLGPNPRPATIPAAIATTFFKAPASSTPTRSSEVYRRSRASENSAWRSRANPPPASATTAADGSPRATPSAKVGPDSAATDAAGRYSRMISDIRRSVSGSIPFAVDRNRRASPRSGMLSKSARKEAQGTAMTAVSECASPSGRLAVARTPAGRGVSRIRRGCVLFARM